MWAPPVRNEGSLQSVKQLAPYSFRELDVGGISERGKEIKRRRHRRKKLGLLAKRLKKATVSEKSLIAAKLRRLTPGAEVIIDRWELRESDR